MEKCIEGVSQAGEAVPEQVNLPAHGHALGAVFRIPKDRYTLPDFDRNFRGKFLQMIVDKLHRRGD